MDVTNKGEAERCRDLAKVIKRSILNIIILFIVDTFFD